MRALTFLLLVISLGTSTAQAQTTDVIVPDLTGLNVPQAAAALNAAGLLLGDEISLPWAQTDVLPPGSVSAQSVAAGTTIPAGSAVSVSVLRAPNLRLIYGETYLTLLNPTGETADLRRLSFAGTGSTTFFAATRLASDLRASACVQVWSVARLGPQRLAGCEVIQRWQTTNNRQEHFWTAANGVQEFAVLDDGVPQATCPAAPVGSDASPLQCDFYYSGAEAATTLTDYLYFSYTPDAIALINISEDRWMPTGETPLYNYHPQITVPGAELRFGDPELFPEQFRRGPGEIERLAPGQCLVMTTAPSEVGAAPEPCTVVAQRDLSPQVAFWLADFEVEGVTTGARATCPAATPEQVTVCIVPR